MKRLAGLFGLLVVIATLALPLSSFGYIVWDPDPTPDSVKFSVYNFYDATLYKRSDNYTTAQEAADASESPNSTDTYITVGQDNNTVPTYYIYRGAFEFNTILLPTNADVSAAEVYFYCKSDNSAVDFSITLVNGSALNSPPVAGNYGQLGDSTDNFGSLTTAAIPTNAYSHIHLSASGLAAIVRGGVTKFGLRSSSDIIPAAPAAEEFLQIWSSESGSIYTPYISITYTLQSFPSPDSCEILTTRVFTDYTKAGDQLFVFSYSVVYNEGDPTVNPGDYFLVQLFDTDGTTLKAQKTLPAWGYSKPMCFYLASKLNGEPFLPSGENYTIRIVGTVSKFPVVQPTASQTLGTTGDTWRGKITSELGSGVTGRKFRAWAIDTAKNIGDYYGESDDLIVQINNVTSLNADGGVIFLAGMPGLDSVCPDLFSSSEQDRDWGTPGVYDPTFKNKLLNNMGTQLMTSFELIGGSVGLTGTWVNSLLWGFFTVAVAVTGLSAGLSIAGMAVGIPALMLGLFMGIPPVIGALLGITLMFLLARTLWAARG